MNYVSLTETIHNKLLRARAVERIVEDAIFERLWIISTESQKEDALEHIHSLRPENLRNWIVYHTAREPEEMGFKELVLVARRRGIKKYSRMTKLELIRVIKNDQATTTGINSFTGTRDETDVQEGEHRV